MGRVVRQRGNLVKRKLNLAGDINARLSLAAELKQLDSQAIAVFDVNGEKAGVDERRQHAVGRGAGESRRPRDVVQPRDVVGHVVEQAEATFQRLRAGHSVGTYGDYPEIGAVFRISG